MAVRNDTGCFEQFSSAELENGTTYPGWLRNESLKLSLYPENENATEESVVFDGMVVRLVFILLYTVAFCLCFFGNLLVILVVTLSRRLRSVTNFFLANLAVADFCVGIFCVYQNLSIYLVTNWVLGDFLCKMYQFTNALSYTASVFILMVICIERYLAIIHPITCKQILTSTKLKLVMATVWMSSALYSAPKFFWVNAVTTNIGNSRTETVCIANRRKFDSRLFDTINFVLLCIFPLAIMGILYTKIALGLWRSSVRIEKQLSSCRKYSVKERAELQGRNSCKGNVHLSRSIHGEASNNISTKNVLRARRGVIKMLIIVVLVFGICNLPFHARKIWQYWSPNYHGDASFSALFTPLTFLVAYLNSGINPLLYAFLSRNFRRSIRELICTCRRRPCKRNARLRYIVTYNSFSLRKNESSATDKGDERNTTTSIC